jgi:hypothetical protein
MINASEARHEKVPLLRWRIFLPIFFREAKLEDRASSESAN